MPNGLLGTRGSQLGKMILGWVAGGDDYIRALGTPALYYRFDEPLGSTEAVDLIGARPGVYSGTTTLVEFGPSYASGYLQTGASLNSTTSPLNIARGSISFWAKLDALPSSNQLLLGFVNSSTYYDKCFYIDSTGTINFTIYDTTQKTLTFTNFTPVGRWNHFVATFDGTQAILYVNGVQAASLSVGDSRSSYTANNNIWVGSGSTSPANTTFPGTTSGHYDEATIWNNLILTPEQVLGLYNVSSQYLTQTNAVITQQSLEVVTSKLPPAQITFQNVEVVYNENPTGRITSLSLEIIRQVAVNDYVPVTYNFTVNSNVSVSQTLTEHSLKTYVYTITNSFKATQTPRITSPVYISIASNAFVDQTLNFRKLITVQLTLTNTFSANQSIIFRNRVIEISLSSSMTADQKIRMERTLTWKSTVSAGQVTHIYKTVTQKLSDTLTLTNHFGSQKTIIQVLYAHLTLSESYSTAGSTHNTQLADFQILTNSIPGSGNYGDTGGFTGVLIVKDIASHPAVTGITVINGLFTTILGSDGLITLPAAEYGDTIAAKIKADIKRSMTGKTYTYIKTNPNDKFSLSFTLGLQKAYELKMFCISNFNLKVYLQLWDGRQFTANIVSENIPLTFEGKWQGPEREKVTVTVDFEGFRTL